MRDDYVWDGSGEPDPEIQRLESVLAVFRSSRPAPEFPERTTVWERWRKVTVHLSFAAVASATVLMIVWVARRPAPPLEPSGWQVTRLAGTPRIGNSAVGGTGRLLVGQWLETDAESRATLEVSATGRLEIDGGTRVQLVTSRPGHHLLSLSKGTIHAMIWAPPGQFVVDTPSARAVDLGCAYSLHVDESGAGLVRVAFGWVGFEFKGHESFIPAGAVCATRPGVGPGTPYFADSSQQLRDAIARLDFDRVDPRERAALLRTVLVESRKRDALTLWHLLSRVNPDEDQLVYSRLSALVPPPPGVTREGVLKGDLQMLDLWWNELGFGDIRWWRKWERAWPQQTSK
ncbi:MAG: FecR domain-containing protein [Terriglobia bacterium]